MPDLTKRFFTLWVANSEEITSTERQIDQGKTVAPWQEADWFIRSKGESS